MAYTSILWDSDDDPDGNVQHIAEHGLDIEDVEWVVGEPESEDLSKTSALPTAWGYTPEGICIIVVSRDRRGHDPRRDCLRSSGTQKVTIWNGRNSNGSFATEI